MSQKTRLPMANQSIRTRTLIYFMVMALSMITLLWAVQEWFFSTQYVSLKQKEIIKTVDSKTKGLNQPYPNDYFNQLQEIVLKGNLKVYFFAFKKNSVLDKGVTEYTYGEETLFRLDGKIFDERVLSPLIDIDDIYRSVDHGSDELGWTPVQQHRFIKMLGLDQSFTSKKQLVSSYDKQAKRLYIATEGTFNEYLGTITHFYFYIEAPLPASDYTLDIVRLEFVLIAFLCLLLAFLFSLLLASFLSRPLTKISNQAQKMAKGDYSVDFFKSNIKELDKLSQTLDFAAKEFSQTESMRREFIANISHDLRTPLTMVKAYAEMIRDMSAAKPEKRAQHAQVIIDESDRLSLLVEDIQKLSKIQAGTDEVRHTVFNLDELCLHAVRQFSVMHEKFGVRLDYNSDGAINVSADRDKISQVLYNLIGNAINYTNKDDKQIVIRLIKKGNKAIVEVEDNGKGIAPEDLDAVWDRYYRANQVKRAIVGSGLGLSIVKNILLAHKATYGVKSELNKGTIFWFSLDIVL